MKVYQVLKRVFGLGPVVHPIDQGLAKHWIKQRLRAVFPELRGNARALEAAYQALDLQPQPGGDGDAETVFELQVHRDPEP